MRGKMATCYIYGAMPCGSTEKLEEGDLLIAADGGYAYLQGQKPDLVVGDFDSLGYVPEGEQIIRHPVQKDDTDMLLAVREGLKRGYRKFVLYGGIGGRLDHTIANLQVLAFLQGQGCQAVLYGEKEEVHLLHNETLIFSAGRKGLLSVFSFEKEEPGAAKALSGEGEFKAGDHCRFCKARFTCRARAEEYLKLAQMEFAEPALMSDEEIAEVLSKADALKKWAEEVYTYAQNEAVVNHKEWPGYKLVLGRSNRKYTDEEDVAEAAQKAGYTDIFKKSLIGITEMERLMGKKKFNEILGSLVYKPDGKVTLVPDSDKREAVKTATAEADFKED